ncbi:MAG: AAA family ATPase [Acidimicrobiales bacterium]
MRSTSRPRSPSGASAPPSSGATRSSVALTASLGAVAAGDRRLVVVQGEAGMGKTRLAQVFAHAVHDAGGHVLWGRCTAENLMAYQPAAEALRTALRAVSPERVRAIVAPRPALRLLLPEGAAPEGALDDGTGARAASRTERYELYEGLAEVIGAVSLTGPVVFVVDDAQWADRSSLHLIEHLVRQDVSGRLLVLATVRRPAGRPTDELDRLVADLRRDQRVDLVTVGGMGASDAVALLGDRGVDVDDLRADALVERTGGNPFFLESLAARGGDILALDDRDLPESVRDLIDLRLEGLDEEAARVLATAAVIGLRVELDVLELASGLGPDELLDQVDAALGSGVLVEDEELGWVAFPHALVRQALIARTTRNREAQLHLRVADAVEARHGAAGVVAVADHLRRAGRLCPPARAARRRRRRRSLNAFADDEARTWGRRAVEAATAIADDDERWEIEAPAQLLWPRPAAAWARSPSPAVLERVEHGARARRDGHVLARAASRSELRSRPRGGLRPSGPSTTSCWPCSTTPWPCCPSTTTSSHRTAVLAWSSIALKARSIAGASASSDRRARRRSPAP